MGAAPAETRRFRHGRYSRAARGLSLIHISEKFDGREKAEAARAEVIGVRTVRVVNVERKEAREQPPLLYDLTTLQKEANSRYGFSAEKTLDIAQSLYEKKFITCLLYTSGNEYDNLYLSAKARSEADWIVGINASQALAVAAGRGVWSLGRVQTPRWRSSAPVTWRTRRSSPPPISG